MGISIGFTKDIKLSDALINCTYFPNENNATIDLFYLVIRTMPHAIQSWFHSNSDITIQMISNDLENIHMNLAAISSPDSVGNNVSSM